MLNMDKRVSDIYISLMLTWMLPHTLSLSIQNPAIKCQQTKSVFYWLEKHPRSLYFASFRLF